jgi:serine/threonine protein kinase
MRCERGIPRSRGFVSMAAVPSDLHLTPAQRAAQRVGSTVLKWRLDALLGVGGTASVYAATHHNRSRVALKILHRELAASAELRARFLREAYVANSVGHEGAVQVLDDQLSEDGEPVLIMPLLEGCPLDALQAARGVLTVEEALGFADQILDVIAAAHARGIIHRDIKPQNVFITTAGAAKVLDFGVARLFDGSAVMTMAGTPVGTPAFMPPEQAGGRTAEVGPASDLWSVGATVFTLLTGRFVHESQNVQEHTVKAAVQPARSIAALRPDLPAPLVEWVDRALSFEIARRFQSAREMREALAVVRAKIAPPRLSQPIPAAAPVVMPPSAPVEGAIPAQGPPRFSDPGPVPAPRFSDPGLLPQGVPAPRYSDPGILPQGVPAPRYSDPGIVPPPRFSDPGILPQGVPAPQGAYSPQDAYSPQAAPAGPEGRDAAAIARAHGLPPPAPKKELKRAEKMGLAAVAAVAVVVVGLIVRAVVARDSGPPPAATTKPTGTGLAVWLGSSAAPNGTGEPASPTGTGASPAGASGGGLAAEEGRAALDAGEAEARKCAKRAGPKGRVSVEVTFHPDGTTTAQVEIAFGRTPVGLCVEEAFRTRARVKPFEGAPVTVTRMVFVQG